jgi:hypothetical protein
MEKIFRNYQTLCWNAVRQILGNNMHFELDQSCRLLIDNSRKCGQDEPNNDLAKSGNKLVKNQKGTVDTPNAVTS